jgi:hypothetical protein
MELAVTVSSDGHLRPLQAMPAAPGIAASLVALDLYLGGFRRFGIRLFVQRGLFRTYTISKFPYRRRVDRRCLFCIRFWVIRRDVNTFTALISDSTITKPLSWFHGPTKSLSPYWLSPVDALKN